MAGRINEERWIANEIEERQGWKRFDPSSHHESSGFRQTERSEESYQVPLILPDGTHVLLPRALFRLRLAIDDSRYIYDLEDDWDQQGAQAISKYTWSRAIRILTRLAIKLYEMNNTKLDSP